MEQSVTKRIAKNFSWLLAGNIASGLINFFAIVYIARVLGAAAFGLVQFALAFLLYLVIIVDCGLSTYGSREIAQDRAKAGTISINIFSLRLLIALATFCLSLLILLIIPVSSVIRLLFLITFLLVFQRALNPDWVFHGMEKMEYLAVSKLSITALTFAFIVIFVKASGDLLRVPLIQLISSLVITAVLLVILFKYFLSFNPKSISPMSWPKTILLAIPLGVSVIFLQIYDNLDTIMLGIMDEPAIVGIYNAAHRMFYIFAGIFFLGMTTVFPIMCKRMSEDKGKARVFLEKILRLTLLMAIPATMLVFLSSPLIIKLFFGNEYNRSALALSCLIWALIPLTVGFICSNLVLIPAGLFNQFLISVGAGALVNIILNIILIPRFSYIGAAVATIIAHIVAGAFAFHFSRQFFYFDFIKYWVKPIAISLVALFIFFLAYLSFAGLSPTVQLLMSIIICMVVVGGLFVYFEFDFISRFTREILRK